MPDSAASDLPLERYLSDYPGVRNIIFCNDSDEKSRYMTAKQMKIYEGKGYGVTDAPPPCGKDYNDYLQMRTHRSRATRPAFSRSR